MWREGVFHVKCHPIDATTANESPLGQEGEKNDKKAAE